MQFQKTLKKILPLWNWLRNKTGFSILEVPVLFLTEVWWFLWRIWAWSMLSHLLQKDMISSASSPSWAHPNTSCGRRPGATWAGFFRCGGAAAPPERPQPFLSWFLLLILSVSNQNQGGLGGGRIVDRPAIILIVWTHPQPRVDSHPFPADSCSSRGSKPVQCEMDSKWSQHHLLWWDLKSMELLSSFVYKMMPFTERPQPMTCKCDFSSFTFQWISKLLIHLTGGNAEHLPFSLLLMKLEIFELLDLRCQETAPVWSGDRCLLKSERPQS